MDRRGIIVCAVSTPEQAKLTSLEQQEKDGRAFFNHEGIELIDVLRIDGYSRNFYTLKEFVDFASSKGNLDAVRLQTYLHNGGFDVLWVRATNRVAREQSINAEIINRAIKECRAQIYSQIDGWITKANRRGVVAITGFRDSSEIDDLKLKRATGMLARWEAGVPVSGNVPFTHRIVKIGKRKRDIRVEVDEAALPVVHDAIKLMIEGVSYDDIEDELYKRHKHVDKNGRPYSKRRFYRLFFTTCFWGNNIIRWQEFAAYTTIHGLWAFNPQVALPPGVHVLYGTHPATVTGEEAAALQAVMTDRYHERNGDRKLYGAKPLTQLIVCNVCGGYYNYATTNGYRYIKCSRTGKTHHQSTLCPNKKMMREEPVINFLNDELGRWLVDGDLRFAPIEVDDATADTRKHLEKEARQLEHLIDVLMEELIRADDDLKEGYRSRIRSTKDRLNALERQLVEEDADTSRQRAIIEQRQNSLEVIRQLGLPRFWELEPQVINRHLKDLLGDYRLTAQDGELKSFALSPYVALKREGKRKE